MVFLKATTTDGETEYFNLEKILSIKPNEDAQRVKLLMGAGLYWWVWADSITIMDLSHNELKNIFGGMNK